MGNNFVFLKELLAIDLLTRGLFIDTPPHKLHLIYVLALVKLFN